MKANTIIILLISFTNAFGQKTVPDLLDELPQGRRGIKQYTKVIMSDSNNAEAYWRRGYEFYRISQYSLAIQDFTKSITKDSTFNHSNVLSERGIAKEMLGMFNEAIVDFSQAITYSFKQDTTLPQGFERYYYGRGRTKFKLGDTLNGIKDLDTALIWWPQGYHIRKLRARLLASTGQYKEAMEDYNYLLYKWNGNGEFPMDKEYAIDFYWRARAKQELGDSSYFMDMEAAKKLKYKKDKLTYLWKY